MLITFIADLIRDEKKQRAFAQDPRAAMAQAGLSEQEQAALASQDRQKVAELLAQELGAASIVCWAAPAVGISSVQPVQGSPGQTIKDFTIEGGWFTEASSMKADIEGAGLPDPVGIQVQSVTGVNQQSSTLTGTLALPESIAPGAYTVRVFRELDKSQATLPMGFTVVRGSPP